MYQIVADVYSTHVCAHNTRGVYQVLMMMEQKSRKWRRKSVSVCVGVYMRCPNEVMKCATALFSFHYRLLSSLYQVYLRNFSDTLFRRCFQVGCKKNFIIKHTIYFATQNCVACIHLEQEQQQQHRHSLLFIYLARMRNIISTIQLTSIPTIQQMPSQQQPQQATPRETFKY